jgi:hypothetical protein
MNHDPRVSVEDYDWLAHGHGARLLVEVATALRAGESEIRLIRELRKQSVSALRSGLVVKQCHLRIAARKKFAAAGQMLFEERLLQQASDERLARYKAQRFGGAAAVVDICCGLGGDALALAAQVTTTAVDRSPLACFLTNHNADVCLKDPVALNVVENDAERILLADSVWFHIDPDRRNSRTRLTRVDDFSPGMGALQRIVQKRGHGAIKIAPASPLPDAWSGICERQWIGDRHECKQQILWFGDCARAAGRRSASAIDRGGALIFEWSEPGDHRNRDSGGQVQTASAIKRFLYEPHATLLAAGLSDSLAQTLELSRLDDDVEYFTGNDFVEHAALAAFEVVEIVRLAPKPVKAALQGAGCAALEVKKRGVEHALMAPYLNMKFSGNAPLVLVLTRCRGQHAAIICRRVP